MTSLSLMTGPLGLGSCRDVSLGADHTRRDGGGDGALVGGGGKAPEAGGGKAPEAGGGKALGAGGEGALGGGGVEAPGARGGDGLGAGGDEAPGGAGGNAPGAGGDNAHGEGAGASTGGNGGALGSGGRNDRVGMGGNGAGGAGKSAGCGTDPPTAPASSMDFDGTLRTFILDVPVGYDKNRSYPVVFAYHGLGIDAEFFRSYVNLEAQVQGDGFVVTLDTEAGGNQGTFDATKDPLFFDALLAKLEAEYCLDPHRVFAMGHAPGGLFASILGCLRGSVLRAIAPLSSANPPTGPCTGKLGVWISQGNNSPDYVEAGQSVRDFWISNNGCDRSKYTAVTPSPCVEYGECAVGYPVRYCQYDGNIEPPSFAPSAIWDFFRALN